MHKVEFICFLVGTDHTEYNSTDKLQGQCSNFDCSGVSSSFRANEFV